MFRKFYPEKVEKTTYDIDFVSYYKAGIRGVLFDIDNTLVPHGKPATKEAIELFQKLKEIGFTTMVMSNNREERVKSFAKEVGGVPYIYKANKPAKKSYEMGMEMIGTTRENTLFVGDQLFTDVWGAKNCGLTHVLVRPMDKKEEIQIILKRYLEEMVLYFYEREKKS